jgi:hypothetical protein
MKKQMKVKLVTPAGSAAAKASSEYQLRNILSVKCMKVHELVDITRGRAMENISL